MKVFKQVVLAVLDGFGAASSSEGNALIFANPRNLNYLINNFPATTLQASGPSVGLPWGERGNSEVGHLNLGAGRIVSQDLPRISRAVRSGDFFKNPAFLAALEHVKKNRSKLHLIGLLSNGGVHSSLEHLDALLAMAAQHQLKQVLVQAFTDGRDSPPREALVTLGHLARKFMDNGVGKIASLTGRFYAMDRGRHWEVTEATYEALVLGEGHRFPSARTAIEDYYARQIFDETIPPTVIMDADKPVGLVAEGDAVIFFNFRPDRMLQLAEAFMEPAFVQFSRKYPYLQNVYYVTMTEYRGNLPAAVAFPRIEIKNGLSETLSRQDLVQFHIAESEKYAHVTSFFNGGRSDPWPGEEREIITSPRAYQRRYRDVPEMSASEIARRVVEKLDEGVHFTVVNFANADMVGHTADRAACVRAVEAVDRSIGEIFQAASRRDACLLITADHGNIEQILNIQTGMIDKEHTENPVPLLMAAREFTRKTPLTKGYFELAGIVPEGVLSDVAPTVLELMGLRKPQEMTGVSLLPLLLNQTS